WSNRTNDSQTVTIDGQPQAQPMVTPSWGSSSSYQATKPQGQDAITYTCKPTNNPNDPGVQGTIKFIQTAVLLLALLMGAFAPSLKAQQPDCGVLLGGELKDIPQIDRDSAT